MAGILATRNLRSQGGTSNYSLPLSRGLTGFGERQGGGLKDAGSGCCPDICPVCTVGNGKNHYPCPDCEAVFYCSERHRSTHKFQHKVVCSSLLSSRLQYELRAENEATQDQQAKARDVAPATNLPSTPFMSPRLQASQPTPPPMGYANGRRAPPHTANSPGLGPGLEGTANTLSPLHSLSQGHRMGTSPLMGGTSPGGLGASKGAGGGGMPSALGDSSGVKLGVPQEDGDDYVQELGRASWTVLHAVANRYPSQPSFKQKKSTQAFLENFAAIYPCEKCQRHFETLVAQYPPQLQSRQSLVRWVGFIHDQVNLILGKPAWGERR